MIAASTNNPSLTLIWVYMLTAALPIVAGWAGYVLKQGRQVVKDNTVKTEENTRAILALDAKLERFNEVMDLRIKDQKAALDDHTRQDREMFRDHAREIAQLTRRRSWEQDNK